MIKNVKSRVSPNFKFDPERSLETLRKENKPPVGKNVSLGKELNPWPSIYEAGCY
jgi:hypothetical protein